MQQSNLIIFPPTIFLLRCVRARKWLQAVLAYRRNFSPIGY
jgi:hypothetical protein